MIASLSVRAGLLTVAALTAFAGNSILNRLALQAELIDPLRFTQIRLWSGAVVLALLLTLSRRSVWADMGWARPRSWAAALALFAYALGFSLSYVALDAGAGALILFAVVQITMVGVGVARGARPHTPQWAGLAIALIGLVLFLTPSQAHHDANRAFITAAPPLWAASLMAIAGVSWGVYSLLGKGEGDPVAATTRNFLLAAPLSLPLFACVDPSAPLAPGGILLAAASGALTSGIGYVVWYAALRHITTLAAAVAQLSVPITAALGGWVLLSEPIGLRLAVASAVILGGIFLVIRPSVRP